VGEHETIQTSQKTTGDFKRSYRGRPVYSESEEHGYAVRFPLARRLTGLGLREQTGRAKKSKGAEEPQQIEKWSMSEAISLNRFLLF
jgi:hypothetical protein